MSRQPIRLTRRGRALVWILATLLACSLAAFTSNYCWKPDGFGMERCDVLAAQLAWTSDAAVELP